MNRKALSLLVAVVMLAAVISMGATLASATVFPEVRATTKVTLPQRFTNDMMPLMAHRTGALKAPLDQYEQVVGFHFNPLTQNAFETAVKNAPFNPISASILLPNGTSSVPTTLPAEMNNSLYLPPIGNQGYVGSCNAWSSTYYVWTYMLNWWRNNPHPSTASDIMNPTFTYNLINGGADEGSNPWDAMNLISTIGAVPLNDFPLYVLGPYGDPSNYAWVWPNLTQWEEAAHNSGTSAMYAWQYYEPGTPELYQIPGQWYYLNFTNATQWNYTKALLAKGYVLQTTINVLPSFQFLGQPGQFLGYLEFYAHYANKFGQEYWTNGSYASWTVEDLLDYAQRNYNVWASATTGNTAALLRMIEEGNMSVDLMKDVLQNKLGINLNEPVYVAAGQLEAAVNASFISNQSWITNATFYLSTYSVNGERWFLNNGFDALFTLANFEWMIHYVPIGEYLQGRAPYLNFNNYYQNWQGGHAVTIVGYDDTAQTPDGQGALLMVNSWGTDWGYNGYWYFSYQAVRSAGEYFNTTVDGIFPVQYQIEWPVSWGGSSAFVYVPKAANYTPDLMAVVGIKHPVRGEVVDGVYGNTQFIPAGIPVGVMVSNDTWEHNFLDFWSDYLWSDITNKTTAADLPQDHPFPNSPMAFDISNAIWNVTYYISTHPNVTPYYATFFVAPHDLLKDNITGYVYNFTILLQTPWGKYPIAANTSKVTIPDGGQTVVTATVPIANYGPLSLPSNSSVNFGSFKVDVASIVPLEGAYVLIGGKEYQLTPEEGGFYYYGTGIDQALQLPAGTYNYTVVVVYPNGKEVALPQRVVTIKEPMVYIKSPEPTVYNTSTLELSVKVVDVLNITNVTATVDGKTISLDYNNTTGLYEAPLSLASGTYTLTVTADDTANNTGMAEVHFVVHTRAKITEVNTETQNVTVGVIGGSAKVTANGSTVVANVSTSTGNVEVQVPLVNNVPSIVVNATAVQNVISGNNNVSLAASWNATLTNAVVSTRKVKSEGSKDLYSVTIKADVKIGEHGVAVVALRNINITDIYVWKNGQKVQLTTDENNPLGYYYVQSGIVFVVLKEDPTIEADGYTEVPVKPMITINTLNFIGYRYYNMYSQRFENLYSEAVKLGVNDTILQQAKSLNETAAQYYQKALDLTGGNIIIHLSDPSLIVPLRKAYLNEMYAVQLLQKAIEDMQKEG
ncbi:C1 family peptidase [Thermococcus sp.]|uniref:C1 family peptidase n=1 Tax=Thermococcus sp. TaxID=35749 RepID=UPI002634E366|nr:C1 family peptidase [Thermococcus sp.]